MPKHSADKETLFKVLELYMDEGDWLGNPELIEKLKDKLQTDEEPQAYTKKIQVHTYYGFLSWEDSSNKSSRKKISESGKAFFEALRDKDESVIFDCLLKAIENNTFGKDVPGLSTKSHVEPPQVFIIASIILKFLTRQEYGFILERLDSSQDSFGDLLFQVSANRFKDNHSYEVPSRYGDAKPITALVNWGFLVIDGKQGAQEKIIIKPTFLEIYIKRLEKLDIFNYKSGDPSSKIYSNLIFFGPPGTGKSYGVDKIVDKKASTRTQFHPEYSYGDFVGSYRPIVGSHKSEIAKGYNGKDIPLPINYFSFVPGPFMVALVDALKKFIEDDSSPQPHYLIIDEINRGDSSSIFGDIFQLLDRNLEGFGEYSIDPRPEIKIWLNHESKGIGDWWIKGEKKLSLPPNFIILGTMNTSDQNLYPMDTAFKRRWEWESCSVEEEYENLRNVYPGITPKLKIGDKEYKWIGLLRELNRLITSGQQGMEDKQIGPWFIKPRRDGTICPKSFANKLLFYLWYDVFKDDLDSENCPFRSHDEKRNEINTFGMLQSLFKDKGPEAIFKQKTLENCYLSSSDVGASGEEAQTSDENLAERPSTDESEQVSEQQDDSNESKR